jgi:ankyrin repeat protein
VSIQPRRNTPTLERPDTINTIQLQLQVTNAQLQLSVPMTAHARERYAAIAMFTPLTSSSPPQSPVFQFGQYKLSSWVWNLDWSSIIGSEQPSHQLTTRSPASATKLEAMCYPAPLSFTATNDGLQSGAFPSLYLALLVNDMAQSGRSSLDEAYLWLRQLAPPVLSRMMNSLPGPVLDTLKERVFVLSIEAGDYAVVQSMLALNVDVREKLRPNRYIHLGATHPLLLAMIGGHFAVARIIIKKMCQDANVSQNNQLLNMIILWVQEARANISAPSKGMLTFPEITDLLCLVLQKGASLDPRCLFAANGDLELAKKILESGKGDLGAWLRAGVLRACPQDSGIALEKACRQLVEEIVRYVIDTVKREVPSQDNIFGSTVAAAMEWAMHAQDSWPTNIITGIFNELGDHLDRNSGCVEATTSDFFRNCRTASQEPSLFSVSESLKKKHFDELNLAATRYWRDSHDFDKSISSRLNQAIESNDIRLACEILDERDADFACWDFDADSVMMKAVALNRDEIVTEVLHRVEDLLQKWHGVDALLQHGKIAVISTLLTRHEKWSFALESASKLEEYGTLEEFLYSDNEEFCYTLPTISLYGEISLEDYQQITARVIAFHASSTNDRSLFKWLLEFGLDPGELIRLKTWGSGSFHEPRTQFFKRPAVNCNSYTFLHEDCDSEGVYPSMLSIAAELNDVEWIRYLIAEGADARDSMALLRAVQYRAQHSTIGLLLSIANGQRLHDKRPYGSAALRQAIRYHDFEVINLLCDDVDINRIEASTQELVTGKVLPTNPLGEGILVCDLDIVRLLLDKGANPNICISHNSWRKRWSPSGDEGSTKSLLARVSPLIAAIDKECLPMVQLLVERGAEINYTRRYGISRTPLQRAAETGQFDIVRFLVTQGASIDTNPITSGATALQLTAMNGYVGIATFLLQQGADPNYPPSKGPQGRTAFEAAVERGRIDAMSLLFQAGVQLDLEVGDPLESQYIRSLRFSENNGFPATRRFLEHLYMQAPNDFSDEDARILGLLPSPVMPMSPALSTSFLL